MAGGTTVSEQRTRLDFARCILEVVDVPYLDANRIVLVLDRLNTFRPASPSAVFPPADAKCLTDRRSTTRPSTAVG